MSKPQNAVLQAAVQYYYIIITHFYIEYCYKYYKFIITLLLLLHYYYKWETWLQMELSLPIMTYFSLANLQMYRWVAHTQLHLQCTQAIMILHCKLGRKLLPHIVGQTPLQPFQQTSDEHRGIVWASQAIAGLTQLNSRTADITGQSLEWTGREACNSSDGYRLGWLPVIARCNLIGCNLLDLKYVPWTTANLHARS